ncbi:hypothetical protein LRS11_21380 [Pseudomonas sp. J452]|uniref:hypothetical protein n=1 Tax=Pseudomonas sp. J452 TaxID=2898441 RepID=UPI0021ADD84D|nr:hypothetical protein [Pseudomonas sp. J452]UUY08313.1 hypothetical protein LRS11_21380 [Pseudomonas sp. J452]
MCSARDSAVSRAQTLGRWLCRPTLQALLVAWLVALGGCASDPPVAVSASTWRQVDRDIARASQAAAEQAREHALLSMQHWMERVYQQTDDEFIPWFSGYWTQQWLSMKVSWYKLSAGGDKDPTVSRLALYLQEQYQERVLEPVAEEDDPDQIMERSTRLYVQELDQRLQGLAQRHAVPQEQFDQRLQAVPAITQAPGASLYELLQADPLKRLPAYVGLIERIRATPGGLADWSTDPGIASVAQRTSERLVDELTTSSAASAVGAMVGRVAGTTLSLGVAIFTAIARANERPETEAQLRRNLQSAFEAEWQELMRNTDRGVLAGVHQLSWQIDSGLAVPFRYQPPR